MGNPEGYRPASTQAGTLLQSATPKRLNPPSRANGLLLRGVVVATYVLDDPTHPYAPGGTLQPAGDPLTPVGVYCDVLLYSGPPGQRWLGLKSVMVLQDGGTGLHDGRIWIPKAATRDINEGTNPASNPAALDGDHVLIGFLNNSMEQPIILGALPHPVLDHGRADGELGVRMGLKLADGRPDLRRHHGVCWGVDNLGNFLVDSRRGNDGALEEDSTEKLYPDDAGKGNQSYHLPKEAQYRVVIYDMADPENPAEIAKLAFQKTGLAVQLEEEDSLTLTGQDTTATLVIGDGAVKATIAGHLQTLYNSLKSAIDTWGNPATGHTHVCAAPGSPSGPPTPALSAPAWENAIASNHLKFPDG